MRAVWDRMADVPARAVRRATASIRSRRQRRSGVAASASCATTGVAASDTGSHGLIHVTLTPTVMPTIIADIDAREILDSRGNPTVEADVILASGVDRAAPRCRAARRTGEHEAIELRDGDTERYLGKGVQQGGAERRGDDRAGARAAWTPTDQMAIDRALIELDGTPNKAKLGANAILAVSMATRARRGAGARPAALPLPRRPAGAHAARADDEHPQRRRARDEHRRLPGVHDRPGRRRDVRRGAAHGRRGVPRAEEGAREAQAARPASATRAASRRTSRTTRRRSRSSSRRSRRRATQPGKEIALALDCAASRAVQGRQVHVQEERRRHARRRRDGRALREVARASIRSSRSRTASPRTTGTAGSS